MISGYNFLFIIRTKSNFFVINLCTIFQTKIKNGVTLQMMYKNNTNAQTIS